MKALKAMNTRSVALLLVVLMAALALVYMAKDTLAARFGFEGVKGIAKADAPQCVEEEHNPDIYFVSCGGFL